MEESSNIYSRFLSRARTPSPAEEASPAEAPIPAKPIGKKRLILSATSKGGVGKSYVSVNLCEWLESQKVPFVAFDPDWCNSTLTRFYDRAEFIDVSEEVQLDNMIRAFERTDLVIVDGVGSLQSKFIDWLEDTRVLEMHQELNLEITLLVIIEEDKETVFQAGQAAQRVGDRADWLVIRNLKTSPVTEIYDNSHARKRLLELGAKEITFERLPWNLNSILQKTSRSLGALSHDESIFFLERQRLLSYQTRIFEEFTTAREILLPGSMLELPPKPEAPPEIEETPATVARPRIPPQEV